MDAQNVVLYNHARCIPHLFDAWYERCTLTSLEENVKEAVVGIRPAVSLDGILYSQSH